MAKRYCTGTELRKWFNHEPEKGKEFIRKYLIELKQNKESVSILKDYLKKGSVTSLYAAKDEVHNEAMVIRDFIS